MNLFWHTHSFLERERKCSCAHDIHTNTNTHLVRRNLRHIQPRFVAKVGCGEAHGSTRHVGKGAAQGRGGRPCQIPKHLICGYVVVVYIYIYIYGSSQQNALALATGFDEDVMEATFLGRWPP